MISLCVRHMPDGLRVPFYVGLRAQRMSDCTSSDVEVVFDAEMKWRRIGRKVVKRWLYFMRWKKLDRVMTLYIRRSIWNPQFVSRIRGFAAQGP